MGRGNHSEEYHESENASTIHGLVPLGGRCVVLAFWKLAPLLLQVTRGRLSMVLPSAPPFLKLGGRNACGANREAIAERARAADGACSAEIPRCRPPCPANVQGGGTREYP
jgi:hypothetical protein